MVEDVVGLVKKGVEIAREASGELEGALEEAEERLAKEVREPPSERAGDSAA